MLKFRSLTRRILFSYRVDIPIYGADGKLEEEGGRRKEINKKKTTIFLVATLFLFEMVHLDIILYEISYKNNIIISIWLNLTFSMPRVGYWF